MKPTFRLALLTLGPVLLTGTAAAQVPDLLNALDAGGRTLATGGANSATNVDTYAAYYNPAALGYLDTKAVDVSYRNLPNSKTTLSGSHNDPDADSDGHRGGSTLGHVGFAVPVRELFGRGSGTLAVAYTLGGYISDHATATSLTNDDGSTTQGYDLRRSARTSFYSLAYGKALDNGLSLGASLVVASQYLSYNETGTTVVDSSSFPLDSGNSSTGTGVGALLGALYTPKTLPEWSFGLSFRTPMSLSGNGSTADEYDRIPARLIAGATWRKDGFRNNKDYLLIGGQVESFFGGDSSQFYDRNSQTLFGFGAEYNVGIGSDRVPLRFGFTTVPPGGDGFGSRDAFTFGIGYRMSRLPIGLDLSFAIPENGGTDFSIAASYRFK